MRKTTALFLFLFILLFFPTLLLASDSRWLLGKWVHTYDPDGDSKDVLTFGEEGRFYTTEVSTGREYEGKYYLLDGEIKINLYHQGRLFVILKLTHDENKDKLYFTSTNTDNTSYYTKLNQNSL